jgi:hypothetical protein
MKAISRFGACALLLAAGLAHAEEDKWELNATGYWNDSRPGESYASGIFLADRGALHLEARANYEAIHAQSAFIGWNLSVGEAVKLDFTPIVGGVTGATRGPIAGFEATITAGRFDYYMELEYVRDRNDHESSYTYAWSELGFRPVEWLRLGAVAQRTKIYGGDRELQRGPFVQATYGKLTLSAYWFNPGSSDQVAIVALGVGF